MKIVLNRGRIVSFAIAGIAVALAVVFFVMYQQKKSDLSAANDEVRKAEKRAATAEKRATAADGRAEEAVQKASKSTKDVSTLMGVWATGYILGGGYYDSASESYNTTPNPESCSYEYLQVTKTIKEIDRGKFMSACLENVEVTVERMQKQ
jgi:hypothetical protein